MPKARCSNSLDVSMKTSSCWSTWVTTVSYQKGAKPLWTPFMAVKDLQYSSIPCIHICFATFRIKVVIARCKYQDLSAPGPCAQDLLFQVPKFEICSTTLGFPSTRNILIMPGRLPIRYLDSPQIEQVLRKVLADKQCCANTLSKRRMMSADTQQLHQNRIHQFRMQIPP